MLHGEIKVNHNEIANWRAVRVGAHIDDDGKAIPGWYIYRCRVKGYDIKGYPYDTGPFLIYHKFDEGSNMLAAKVLFRTYELLLDTKSSY